jgi:hypothetical protein
MEVLILIFIIQTKCYHGRSGIYNYATHRVLSLPIPSHVILLIFYVLYIGMISCSKLVLHFFTSIRIASNVFFTATSSQATSCWMHHSTQSLVTLGWQGLSTTAGARTRRCSLARWVTWTQSAWSPAAPASSPTFTASASSSSRSLVDGRQQLRSQRIPSCTWSNGFGSSTAKDP